MSRRRGAQNALTYACGGRSHPIPGPSIPQHAAYSQAASSIAPHPSTPHASLHRLHQIPSSQLHVSLAFSSLWNVPGSRRLQSTQEGHAASSSNLELHPTPVDYSLFEDPEDNHTVQAQQDAQENSSHASSSSLSSYTAPSPSQVVEGVLRSGGDALITDAKLTEATATLRQFEALHGSESEKGEPSDMGQPPSIYLSAAFAAFTKGRPAEALHWIRAGPAWPDAPHSSHKSKGAKKRAEGKQRELNHLVNTMLIMLSNRATRSPASLRNAIVALVAKGYHASEPVAQQLVLALKDALHVLPSEKGQARELWKQLLAAHGSVDLAAQASIETSRTFLTMALNATVRHLALQERREEATELVEEAIASAMAAARSAEIHGNDGSSSSSSSSSTSWSAPIRVFTYNMFLSRLVRGRVSSSTFAAYRIQASLQELVDVSTAAESSSLKQKRQAKSQRRSRSSSPVINWSASQASLLVDAGARILLHAGPSDPTKLQATASSRKKKASAYHSEDDVLAAIETGKVGRARRLMMLNISKAERNNFAVEDVDAVGEFAHLPSTRLLARYQEASLAAAEAFDPPQQEHSVESTSSIAPRTTPPKPSWVCEDAELEKALTTARAGKGLWQTAHLWRLHRARRFAEGLAYFEAQWHRAPDLPLELVSLALHGVEAAEEDTTFSSGSHVSPSPSSSEGNEDAAAGKLWPSSYAVDLAVRCVIDLVRVPSASDISLRHSPAERLPIVRGTLAKLEKCYQIWRESVTKHALQARGALRVDAAARGPAASTSMSGRRLDSQSFDAWIVALASERQKEDGVTLWKEQREESGQGMSPQLQLRAKHDHTAAARWPTRDAATVVASLHLFEDMPVEAGSPSSSHDPQQRSPLLVSRASHRALQVLEDMQDLDVQPSASTYTIVLDTLARDAGSSYHGVGEEDNAAWRLVLHLAQKIGLAEGSQPQPQQRHEDEADETAAGASQQQQQQHATLVTYSALLRSLLAKVPQSRRGESDGHLDKAIVVQRWLADAVKRASSAAEPAEDGESAGQDASKSGLAVVKEADIAANARVMEVLKSLAQAVKERQQREQAQLEEEQVAPQWGTQAYDQAAERARRQEIEDEDDDQGEPWDEAGMSMDHEGGYRDRRAAASERW